jgi:hypothetical protein
MKSTYLRRMLLAAIIGCTLGAAPILEDRRVQPVKAKELAGEWLGYDEDMLSFYRLELSQDGRGSCSTTFLDNPATIYRVERWSLDGYNIDIKLSPASKEAEPIYMKGTTALRRLSLEVGGLEIKWTRQLSLLNEHEFLRKWNRVKTKMEAFKKESGRGSP